MRLIDADKIPFDMVMQNPFDEQSEKVEVIKKRKIEQMPTIQAIPLDRIKQARERIQKLADMCGEDDLNDIKAKGNFGLALQIIDEVVFESEEK